MKTTVINKENKKKFPQAQFVPQISLLQYKIWLTTLKIGDLCQIILPAEDWCVLSTMPTIIQKIKSISVEEDEKIIVLENNDWYNNGTNSVYHRTIFPTKEQISKINIYLPFYKFCFGCNSFIKLKYPNLFFKDHGFEQYREIILEP